MEPDQPPPQVLRFAFWSKASAKREQLVPKREGPREGERREGKPLPLSHSRRPLRAHTERERERERDVWERGSNLTTLSPT